MTSAQCDNHISAHVHFLRCMKNNREKFLAFWIVMICHYSKLYIKAGCGGIFSKSGNQRQADLCERLYSETMFQTTNKQHQLLHIASCLREGELNT